jgi:hypothetical protein
MKNATLLRMAGRKTEGKIVSELKTKLRDF